MTIRFILACLVTFIMFFKGYQGAEAEKKPASVQSGDSLFVIPVPEKVALAGKMHVLSRPLKIHTADKKLAPLLQVIDYEFHMLTGARVTRASTPKQAQLHLKIDRSLQNQQYRLETTNTIAITGGSYRAVAMGSVTLMQMVEMRNGKPKIPAGIIEDRPDSDYRGLLIDVARNSHGIEVLKQLILLCRWYKINYLQLHLTDDAAFTFPAGTYPELSTPGQYYTKDQLKGLDEFARDHGVTLVPELEVPGHAGQFVQQMPEVFGIENGHKNNGTINMGRDGVYKALSEIVGEIAGVFQTSPYIHIGGDEANLDFLAEDSSIKDYMVKNNLGNVEELYRHFLVRMNDIVKKHGKKTIVWEGFSRDGKIKVPTDIIVMAWETLYQLPQRLLADGYRMINVSWKPLYVANDRKWSPEYIYNWNMYRWENWLPKAPSYNPIQLKPNTRIFGASMASWAQPQYLELPALKKRVPAMSERIWNATLKPKQRFSWFEKASTHTNSRFEKLISPIEIFTEGLRYPDIEEGRRNEQYWFDDELRIRLEAESGQVIYYTLDGSAVTRSSKRYSKPFDIKNTVSFRAKAFSHAGEPVGYSLWHKYRFRPLEAQIEGDLKTPLSELWRKPHDRIAEIEGEITIQLTNGREGIIRYTTDGTHPSQNSEVYRDPIRLSDDAIVTAQLFTREGKAIGEPWQQPFKKVRR